MGIKYGWQWGRHLLSWEEGQVLPTHYDNHRQAGRWTGDWTWAAANQQSLHYSSGQSGGEERGGEGEAEHNRLTNFHVWIIDEESKQHSGFMRLPRCFLTSSSCSSFFFTLHINEHKTDDKKSLPPQTKHTQLRSWVHFSSETSDLFTRRSCKC